MDPVLFKLGMIALMTFIHKTVNYAFCKCSFTAKILASNFKKLVYVQNFGYNHDFYPIKRPKGKRERKLNQRRLFENISLKNWPSSRLSTPKVSLHCVKLAVLAFFDPVTPLSKPFFQHEDNPLLVLQWDVARPLLAPYIGPYWLYDLWVNRLT